MNAFFSVSANEFESDSGFKLLGIYHLSWILAIITIALFLSLGYKFASKKCRRVILFAVSGGMLITEAVRQIILFYIGESAVGYLPLHLCSINMFVCFFYSIKYSEFTGELLYALCLPGTIMALLFPNWTSLPTISFITITSFIIHGLLFIYPIILLINRSIKPNFKRLPMVFSVLLIYAVIIYYFNKIYNTNFMFLNGAGEGNPLTVFEDKLGNPGYFIAFPIFLTAVWFVLYIPWVIASMRKKNK